MSRRICVLVFTDGRQGLLERTMRSFTNIMGAGHLVENTIIVDDSGDEEYHRWLKQRCDNDLHRDEPERGKLVIHPSRLGFAGTIHDTWVNHVPKDTDFIFHLEDDFELLPEPKTSFADMCAILEQNPHLVQVALVRQPWNTAEKEAGGLLKVKPENFIQRETGGIPWIEQSSWFTTNPCLYRADLIKRIWPWEANSEGIFTIRLRDAGFSFGYLGKLEDPHRVMHIGEQRIGGGY